MVSAHTLTFLLFSPLFAFLFHFSHHPSLVLSLCVSFPPLIAGATDDNSASNHLSVGFRRRGEVFFEFEAYKPRLRTGRDGGMYGWVEGWGQ